MAVNVAVTLSPQLTQQVTPQVPIPRALADLASGQRLPETTGPGARAAPLGHTHAGADPQNGTGRTDQHSPAAD
jgi:hypothetical protein